MSGLVERFRQLDSRQRLVLFIIIATVIIFMLFVLSPERSQPLTYNYLTVVESTEDHVIVEASKELSPEEKQKLEAELQERNSGKQVEVKESYEYSEEKEEILEYRTKIEIDPEDYGGEQFPSQEPLHGGDYGQ